MFAHTKTFQGVRAVQEGVDIGIGVYRPPQKLRKRSERSSQSDRVVEPNTDATGVELHKDSKWSQSWQDFRDNNTYVNKVFDWKMKFDESDNTVIRATRILTDKMTDIFGGLFQKTELSEVLTEISKMDPEFEREAFLKEVETDIIPNVLEAMVRGDLEILQDWCHEGVSLYIGKSSVYQLMYNLLQGFQCSCYAYKTSTISWLQVRIEDIRSGQR